MSIWYEIPTIFNGELPTSYPLQSRSPKPQVTFTTGLVTVIFVTVTVGVFSTICQYFPTPISFSVQGYVFTLAMSTMIPG